MTCERRSVEVDLPPILTLLDDFSQNRRDGWVVLTEVENAVGLYCAAKGQVLHAPAVWLEADGESAGPEDLIFRPDFDLLHNLWRQWGLTVGQHFCTQCYM